jgi:hypothetical protein
MWLHSRSYVIKQETKVWSILFFFAPLLHHMSITDYKYTQPYTLRWYYMTCAIIFHSISSHQMFSFLWYGAYENLVVSSVGLKRFSLIGSSFSSRADMGSLGCVISFSRYLVLYLVISALTVGTCRSVCRIVFGTYRGALTIDLSTLFWNLCSILMLELLAVPQRGKPYVQMGFRIVLYISNLFSSDCSDFLPMIQYMRWSCNPSCFLLVNMCFCHVSLRSRWMPKYLAVSPCGICCPSNVTAGQVSRFREKVMWVDLFLLAFMRHRFNQFISQIILTTTFYEGLHAFQPAWTLTSMLRALAVVLTI